MLRTLPLLLAAALLTGCASFDETFHFTANAPGSPFTQYYRVKIEGFGLLASSEYASGLYDAEAVDSLFGELQGGSIRIGDKPASSKDGDCPAEDEADDVKSLDGQPMGDRRLVLFLSSKANGLVSRIKAFTSSRQVTSSLTTLLLKDDVTALSRARALEPAQAARAESFATVLDQTAQRLKDLDGAATENLDERLRQIGLKK